MHKEQTLNDMIYSGPKLQRKLFVLLRFKCHPTAVVYPIAETCIIDFFGETATKIEILKSMNSIEWC